MSAVVDELALPALELDDDDYQFDDTGEIDTTVHTASEAHATSEHPVATIATTTESDTVIVGVGEDSDDQYDGDIEALAESEAEAAETLIIAPANDDTVASDNVSAATGVDTSTNTRHIRQLSQTVSKHHPHPSISLHTVIDDPHLIDLQSLGIQSSDDYMRMFRAVLTLQRKCRVWRARIRERIRLKLLVEQQRQEAEMQTKIEKKKMKTKLEINSSAISSQSSTALPSPMSRTQPLWTVELPTDEHEILKFTLCMMKIQQRFRVKLAKARERLKVKLRVERETQEAKMKEKLEKRKAKNDLSASSTLDLPLAKAAVPPLSLTTTATEIEPVSEEPIRGSLTSRLRKEREKRREERMTRILAETEAKHQSLNENDIIQQRLERAQQSASRAIALAHTDTNNDRRNDSKHEKANEQETPAVIVSTSDASVQADEEEACVEQLVNDINPALLYIQPSTAHTYTLNSSLSPKSARSTTSHATDNGNGNDCGSGMPTLASVLGDSFLASFSSLPLVDSRQLKERHLTLMARLAQLKRAPSATHTESYTDSEAKSLDSSFLVSTRIPAPHFLPSALVDRLFPVTASATGGLSGTNLLSLSHLLYLPMDHLVDGSGTGNGGKETDSSSMIEI